MGGFRINGCGAVDYFDKMKHLGNYMCYNCKKVTPFYLAKGKLKLSVLWIPTVTMKERYGIVCGLCLEGKWIEDAEAYKLLGVNSRLQNETLQNQAKSSVAKCPKCGAEMDGAFCGRCGTKYVSKEEPAVLEEENKQICPKCGTEVDGAFCSKCGTKYVSKEESVVQDKEDNKQICPNCGAEVNGAFCGKCGTKLGEVFDIPIEDETKSDEKVGHQEWECSLCGTKNPKNSNKCSLCGCEKD